MVHGARTLGQRKSFMLDDFVISSMLARQRQSIKRAFLERKTITQPNIIGKLHRRKSPGNVSTAIPGHDNQKLFERSLHSRGSSTVIEYNARNNLFQKFLLNDSVQRAGEEHETEMRKEKKAPKSFWENIAIRTVRFAFEPPANIEFRIPTGYGKSFSRANIAVSSSIYRAIDRQTFNPFFPFNVISLIAS